MCVLASAVDIFSSHLIIVLKTVLQLSWLERYTDNVEVGSSSLPGTTKEIAIEEILEADAGNQLSWLEHLPCTQGVKGSNPLFSTEEMR